MGKKEILSLFSSNPEKYYQVNLFEKFGFKRFNCSVCGKFFWSLVDKDYCPDHENYSFISNPPTKYRFDFVKTWQEISKYFKDNNHSIINRYPVVCRWREDLYYTIASIVNFQRIVGDNLVFELPSNPLVVPQMCLRFNDIENVGISGRHYTSFCMVGQTCNADITGGYWKDKCIELDFGMLTNVLGIKPEEISFVEDVWMGAGSFGYSLEYFVRGLELGNAVFTEFEGNEHSYKTLPNRIIDMGAGLERLSWITMGTPTSYDCCFGPIVDNLKNEVGILYNNNDDILTKYFSLISKNLNDEYDESNDHIQRSKLLISKEMKISLEDLNQIIRPMESLYTIVDHTRTLLFAISDGSLPSNVGGGYNLRILLRRIISIMEKMKWNINIGNIIDSHISYLKHMYPELEDHRDDVQSIIKIESDRYFSTKNRMVEIANSIKNNNKSLSLNDLITLYESDGITPDYLQQVGVIQQIPENFYTKLAEIHEQQHTNTSESQKKVINTKDLESYLSGLESTDLLYYKDLKIRNFVAKILKIIPDKKIVILDKTAFYPRGGGQEPDLGMIEGNLVKEVVKTGEFVLHYLNSLDSLIEGKTVNCIIDAKRRDSISRHHSATHVLNSSARTTLGSWVWQHSAFKDQDYARLDITHHSSLSKEDIQKIETTANNVIMKNLPIDIKFYDRGESEQKFSFRIYQGGVVPSNKVRIVNIGNWDIEACGGTHIQNTGEIGLIKIIKTERIQDGVVRLEFVGKRERAGCSESPHSDGAPSKRVYYFAYCSIVRF